MKAMAGEHSGRIELTDEECSIYEWQLLVRGFGRKQQRALKASSVLVSRVGGVGGAVAMQLAAAGVGRLVLAHAGRVGLSDLNRQLLVTADSVGKSRIECVARRLREFNPRIEIEAIAENITPDNAERLVGRADLVMDCAPMFEERFAMNRAAVHQQKPLVECAMYELEAYLTSIVPSRTPCLNCLWREKPSYWTRKFPVFGAVSGAVGSLAAMEAIKLLTGLGEPLLGRLLTLDLFNMNSRTLQIARSPDCEVCGDSAPSGLGRQTQ
jgi:molybdopterin/thiamine biosynthesis adenylyltransferase